MNLQTALNTEGTEKRTGSTERCDTNMVPPMGERMVFSVYSVSLWPLC